MGPLLALGALASRWAVGGAVVGLLMTAVADFMQSDEPDPDKVEAVKEAQAERLRELMDQGVEENEANAQVAAETSEAMVEAMKPVDRVTGKDYAGAAIGGAISGGMFPVAGAAGSAIAKSGIGQKVAGKLPSFLRSKPAVATPAAATAAPVAASAAVKDQVYSSGFKSPTVERGLRGEFDSVTPDVPRLTTTSFRMGEGNIPTRPNNRGLNIGMREGKTIDVASERLPPRLDMADDATLNAAVDEIIEQAMSPRPLRIGYTKSFVRPSTSKKAQMERMFAMRDPMAQAISKDEAFRSMGL